MFNKSEQIAKQPHLFERYYSLFTKNSLPVFKETIDNKPLFEKNDFKMFWEEKMSSECEYNPLGIKVFEELVKEGEIIEMKEKYIMKDGKNLKDFSKLIEEIIHTMVDDGEKEMIEIKGWKCYKLSVEALYNEFVKKAGQNENFNDLLTLIESKSMFWLEGETLFYKVFELRR